MVGLLAVKVNLIAGRRSFAKLKIDRVRYPLQQSFAERPRAEGEAGNLARRRRRRRQLPLRAAHHHSFRLFLLHPLWG